MSLRDGQIEKGEGHRNEPERVGRGDCVRERQKRERGERERMRRGERRERMGKGNGCPRSSDKLQLKKSHSKV